MGIMQGWRRDVDGLSGDFIGLYADYLGIL